MHTTTQSDLLEATDPSVLLAILISAKQSGDCLLQTVWPQVELEQRHKIKIQFARDRGTLMLLKLADLLAGAVVAVHVIDTNAVYSVDDAQRFSARKSTIRREVRAGRSRALPKPQGGIFIFGRVDTRMVAGDKMRRWEGRRNERDQRHATDRGQSRSRRGASRSASLRKPQRALPQCGKATSRQPLPRLQESRIGAAFPPTGIGAVASE